MDAQNFILCMSHNLLKLFLIDGHLRIFSISTLQLYLYLSVLVQEYLYNQLLAV